MFEITFHQFLSLISVCVVVAVIVYVYVMLSFRKKKEEMASVIVKIPPKKGELLAGEVLVSMPKTDIEKIKQTLVPTVEFVKPGSEMKPSEILKPIPPVRIKDKPTVETQQPSVIKYPKCKQTVIRENLIPVINHAKGITEYVTPCCQEVVTR